MTPSSLQVISAVKYEVSSKSIIKNNGRKNAIRHALSLHYQCHVHRLLTSSPIAASMEWSGVEINSQDAAAGPKQTSGVGRIQGFGLFTNHLRYDHLIT